MKKIYIIIGSLDIGGTEKQLLLKLKNLKDKFDFTLIVFSKKGELYDDFKKSGINIHDISSNSKLAVIKISKILLNFFWILKKNKPNIVNFYLPHSYLIFGWFAFLFPKINFIMTRRSLNFYQNKYPLIKLIENKILHKKMSCILVNSKAIFNQLLSEEGVRRENLKLIYNSVNVKKITKTFTQGNQIRILHLANIIPYKNHKLIIEVCRNLNLLNFRVDFVGSGSVSYINSLKSLVKKYNVENKIKFRGRIKNLENVIEKYDVGILASDEEGFSNAILEYMSKKLPVVATNVGGNSEIIKHLKNGYIVEKGDYKTFSKFLKKLILNVNLRKKLGLAGFKMVKKKFEVSKNIINYYNFYKNLTINN